MNSQSNLINYIIVLGTTYSGSQAVYSYYLAEEISMTH